MRRTPLKAKRSRPRRTKTPRCEKQRCNRPARYGALCFRHAQLEADAIIGARVRARARCKAKEAGWAGAEFDCGGGWQWCHLVPRGYHRVRWDEENAVCMCAAHHKYFDDHPLEREETIELWIGQQGWWELKRRARDTSTDWRDRLRKVLEEARDDEAVETGARVREGPR